MKNKKIYIVITVLIALGVLIKTSILISSLTPTDEEILAIAKEKIPDTAEVRVKRYINSIPVECALSEENRDNLIELILASELYIPDPNLIIAGMGPTYKFEFYDKNGEMIATYGHPYLEIQKREINLENHKTEKDLEQYLC